MHICDLLKNYGDFVQSSVCTTFATIMLLSGGHNPNDYFATLKLIQYTQCLLLDIKNHLNLIFCKQKIQ